LYGLVAALTWGAADFTGGLVSKRVNPYAVTVWADVIALPIIALLACWFGDPFPNMSSIWYSLASGLFGGVGIVMLYTALANGKMTIVAPISALIAAIIPIILGVATDGLPSLLILAGIFLALASIWL
jgi:uncharacterized membrane protein